LGFSGEVFGSHYSYHSKVINAAWSVPLTLVMRNR
jgi:hypothetical protein